MKVEAKLALNNMRKNKKRTLFTTISLILCTTLILTTIILISSIRNGVSENFDVEYNDYHITLNNLSPERFNSIKNKTYIDKIYIQKHENAPMEKVDASYTPKENVIVHLKYKNIKNVCKNSSDVLATLDLSDMEIKNLHKICNFNQQLLTVHGFIDVAASMDNSGVISCRARVNYSYVIDLMIIVIIIAFSAFFIIILYNAFLITINERKKEYAILNSVGGTEGQVLKMVFTEAILMEIVGIVVGLGASALIANVILGSVNNILNTAGYYFRLIVDAKYIALSIIIIAINIYLSVLIPSLKASSTSVIQGIRNNKQIKYKGKNTILEKILPIEGKVAIKNIKRNKSKYRLITILLVISITSFIAMSTYLKYEKETADIVSEYDVDAEIAFTPKYVEEYTGIKENRDYKPILKEYEEKYGKKVENIEYQKLDGGYASFLVEPAETIISDTLSTTHIDNTKGIEIQVIGLDDKTYGKYIKEVNANYGDFIIYNVSREETLRENSQSYNYVKILKENQNLSLKLINYKDMSVKKRDDYEATGKFIWDYEIIDTADFLDRKIVLTDKMVEGFKERKASRVATMFMNMETFNQISNYIDGKYGKLRAFEDDGNTRRFWHDIGWTAVKIKCDNIIEFKNYMEEAKQNLDCEIVYYTLENQEKIVYIKTVELILKVMLGAIVFIGIVSIINITNASLCERKEDFNILYRMGATKGNVKKILIYECVHMFIKGAIISIILSIPIIYKIVKHMENILTLNKLLIPYGEIAIFLGIMFVISLAITVFSTRMIKEE